MRQVARVLMKQLMNCVRYNYEGIYQDVKMKFNLFHEFLAVMRKYTSKEVNNWGAIELLQWIVRRGNTESLSKLDSELQICLTICIRIARFSKLKLFKTYLRYTMSESRLSNLAILQ